MHWIALEWAKLEIVDVLVLRSADWIGIETASRAMETETARIFKPNLTPYHH